MFMLRAHADIKLTSLSLPRIQSSRFSINRSLRFGFLARNIFCCSREEVKAMKSEIELTESEEKIFKRLLDVVRHHNLDTQLRVAGGWVRDKLLKRECYDIDIALDNMYGRQFCEKIKDYLGEEGGEGGYCVIQSNPDQSKHLETARMRVYDMMIDFVNLRSEKYSENSRIPEMEFGSPEEDALRRDLTINSLFYNISIGSIEDYTGRGIEDLKHGRIVTPLPAKETFLEDPLRVLRAIRFGARFEFSLDGDLKSAAADSEVKAALKEKISRERVGHEIDLVVAGNQPVKAIHWIHEFQLFWVVFTPPDNTEPAIAEQTDGECVEYMDAAWNALQLIRSSISSNEQHRICLYAALFLPLRASFYTDKKLKKIPCTSYIFRNSLKLKVSDAEIVSSLHEASQGFVSLIDSLEPGCSEILSTELEDDFFDVTPAARRRILAGLLLRKIKDFWRVALLLSTFLYQKPDQGKAASCSKLDDKVKLFRRVEAAIVELKLEDVWKMKPLLDGNALMNVLQIKGKQIGEWQQRLLRWQLAHPEGTADDCREWIKQSHSKRMKMS